MSSLPTLHDEVDKWFSKYFATFIDICAGRAQPAEVLRYWGVPLHSSSPNHSKWQLTSEEVVGVLNDMQAVLKQLGYTHTEAIDKKISVYSQNASRVDTIMSRRRGDGTEVDRAAVSFALRRAGDSWIIISTTALPTESTALHQIW